MPNSESPSRRLRLQVTLRFPVTLRFQVTLRFPVTLRFRVTLRFPVTLRFRVTDSEDSDATELTAAALAGFRVKFIAS
eukprot:1650079-Rhodomonas_salina.2